ncbi:MAG TPA: hypothetical protein VLV54_17740, partial [Thermoanaerobaculia bacterium]|nr:hypothetical protein [Thermoanaerobaculia bacterium]
HPALARRLDLVDLDRAGARGRAKRLAILVGEEKALRIAVGNRRLRGRFTRLAERLAGPAGEPS